MFLMDDVIKKWIARFALAAFLSACFLSILSCDPGPPEKKVEESPVETQILSGVAAAGAPIWL